MLHITYISHIMLSVGEQGVMCQAQALAALVDENGKLQSSHSQSQVGLRWNFIFKTV